MFGLWKLYRWRQLGGAIAGLSGIYLMAAAAHAQPSPPLSAPTPPAADSPLEDQAQFWVNFPTFATLNSTFCRRAIGQDQQFCNIADVAAASFDSTPSDVGLTLPSLWWTRDQLPRRMGGRKLVRAWVAYGLQESSTSVVDVFMDNQIWSVLNPYEHYSVLNQFGSATQAYGYHLRLFTGQGRGAQLAGIYLCEFDQPGSWTARQRQSSRPTTCQATIDPAALDRYQRPLD